MSLVSRSFVAPISMSIFEAHSLAIDSARRALGEWGERRLKVLMEVLRACRAVGVLMLSTLWTMYPIIEIVAFQRKGMGSCHPDRRVVSVSN